MTTKELTKYFNDTYGITRHWPDTFEVDAETYGNVCQLVFNNLYELVFNNLYDKSQDWPILIAKNTNVEITIARVALGPHKGIMFKGVELILKNEK